MSRIDDLIETFLKWEYHTFNLPQCLRICEDVPDEKILKHFDNVYSIYHNRRNFESQLKTARAWYKLWSSTKTGIIAAIPSKEELWERSLYRDRFAYQDEHGGGVWHADGRSTDSSTPTNMFMVLWHPSDWRKRKGVGSSPVFAEILITQTSLGIYTLQEGETRAVCRIVELKPMLVLRNWYAADLGPR